MDLIEPQRVYDGRCGVLSTCHPLALPNSLSPPPRPLGDDFWTAAVFDTLRNYADEPAKITSLVNAVGSLGNFSRRADYDQKRIELFRCAPVKWITLGSGPGQTITAHRYPDLLLWRRRRRRGCAHRCGP